MDANAKLQPPLLGNDLVPREVGTLDFNRTTQRRDGALELDEEGVANSLDFTPIESGETTTDQCAMFFEQLERKRFSLVRHGRITDDVGKHRY